MAEALEELGDRPGWKVDGAVASYCPQSDGWTAQLRIAPSGRYYARWHVAVIDPHGIARYVKTASMLGEAVRLAEGIVRGQTPAA